MTWASNTVQNARENPASTALRGDLPPGGARPAEGFDYASDLVPFVRAKNQFCIGVAGYPESHPQSLNPTRDFETPKKKVDAGAPFLNTHWCVANADF